MTKKPARTIASAAQAASQAPEAGAEAEARVSNRAARAAERRAAIVEAAMDEFIARGFAATRLDEIAKRAGVAKGTIYLHFKDKESMFEELVRTVIVPVVTRLTTLPPPTGTVRDLVETFASNFLKEVIGTRRGDLVRLIVAEGPRFPSVADFYYREVVSRGIAGMRALIELGIARGEIREKNLARFPQILVAPAMIAVIWQSLFARHAPLDAQEMLRVHLDLIFGERRTT
ncbi:helix-turn-helix transcriptional regulator [Bradyrhizobium sp. 180]|uniref:TetR/AcrR family transcriptional regulator n=1 Tax=unclassified Bradyrhizobium TaxID=2631580 RepID=UPI001FF93B02|nr:MULTISPECIES: TetR/AcrR family transcriptional regulator [unclassified Bradyrhizobium]MCK1424414.1 helix-turn-helix transcriptional regulator [Bradyrhizobium sp. CW12]MCK1495521.1 helix-turn-helix transcriptional regulator [Bradyrhizobium sp. 180]MCK1529192.1 helix-turn-helix transcriptional regulator [Bradyrhizobium sp. 182]MCK1596381.1 helix-turn-helix transcriptional regulator [Bradyrhizobium sp. 164]MCK1618859.1 helix-turn-helix transcriptional regulator [Bradyrhizobium sp. 159]